MPDDNTAGNQNNGANGGATDANTNTETQNAQAFDPSKVGDEDFSKIFEDPRLWTHPRFKGLTDAAKKAKEYEEKEAQREIEEKKKKGEWEQVAKNAEEKLTAAEQRYQTAITDNRIQSEAAKLGVVDLEAVTKLIDRSQIKVADDGSVTGVEESVKSLLESKPYLKGTGETVTTVGQGTSPGQGETNGLKRFKMSQLQDAKYYRENEKDILASMKVGLVEDDLPS